MNKSKVITWIKNPSSIAEDDTRELREIINEFPASPILHWLYLKGLQNQKSYLFNSALSRTAIASPDRSQLLKWVGQADDEHYKKQKFEFKVPEEKEAIPPVQTAVPQKVKEEPVVAAPPKPKKKAELPDEIKVLLEKSRRIREGYHGEPEPIEEETIAEVPQPAVPPVTPEPEIIPEIILDPIPPTFEPSPLPEVSTEPKPEIELIEPFAIDLDLGESIKAAEPVNPPAETEIPQVTSFEIVLEDYDEPNEFVPETPATESVIISLDASPREPTATEATDFTSWLKTLHGKNEEPIQKPIPESQKTPIQELTFEIEPEVELPKPKETNKTIAHKIELIDKFLEVRPKIKPTRESIGGMTIPETVDVDENQFITETLAQIYVEQGHYNKAIEAFEILGLKYPEKNGFFADRIREIKRRK